MNAHFLAAASNFTDYTLEMHNCVINLEDVRMRTFKSNFLREIIHILLFF